MAFKMEFDDDGNLIAPPQDSKSSQPQEEDSEHLNFLKDEKHDKPKKEFWNLHVDGSEVDPLRFSNDKTQEDVVKEISGLISKGAKVIFLRGACGTGKSAIALNLARLFGKTSIVVPIRNLQRQYEKDYTSKKFLVKPDGIRLKIAVLTGKENHPSIFMPRSNCADPRLPENLDLRDERNWKRMKEYFDSNPNNHGKVMPDMWKLRRIMIAPANPYWSPIFSSEYDINLDCTEKLEYECSEGNKCIFYWRKKGCGYYDQHAAYAKADVLVFNSAKYLSEMLVGRKPATEIEIFDEGDEFLDNLFQQKTINLNKLSLTLTSLPISSDEGKKVIRQMTELIRLEIKNKKVLGIDEEQIFNINDTKMKELLELFSASGAVNYEISTDTANYANEALEAAMDFKDVIDDVYLSFSKKDGELYIHLACTSIKAKLDKIKNQSKVLIFMSGTMHSKEILRKVFGFDEFRVVEAETVNPGSVELLKIGQEFKCNYRNMQVNRERYLKTLGACVSEAKEPVLVQVHAYKDLPSKDEQEKYALDVLSSDELRKMQWKDKQKGKLISDFIEGHSNILYSTTATRGMDFPGEICNSIIFTKFPFSNVRDIFWRVLEKTHPTIHKELYFDKAKREFHQRLYRALRFKHDRVSVLSPDSRVIEAIRNMS